MILSRSARQGRQLLQSTKGAVNVAPKAKKVETITVEMSEPQEKKHVTRYDEASGRPDAALRSIYIDRQALANIGSPAKIKVTIEPA